MVRISVIIPCHNAATYIEKCLESVCAQTIADQLQIVLIDDGSTDGSAELARNFLEQRGRLQQTKIICLPQNKGVANARIAGIREADGEYLMFFDADDWADLTMCEKMLRKAEEDNCDMVVCDYNCISGDKVEAVADCYKEPFLQQLILCTVTGALWNKLARRDIFLRPDFRFPVHDFSEDHAYCLQLTIFATKIGYVPEPMYNYLRRNDSFVRKQTSEMVQKRYDDDIANFNLELEVLKDAGLDDVYKGEVTVRKLRTKNGYCQNRQLWLDTFPGLGREILQSPFVTWRSRIVYLLRLVGLKS